MWWEPQNWPISFHKHKTTNTNGNSIRENPRDNSWLNIRLAFCLIFSLVSKVTNIYKNLLFYVNKFYIYIFWSEEVSASPVFSIWGKWNQRFVKKAVYISYKICYVYFLFLLFNRANLHIALLWCVSQKNWKLIWKKCLNQKSNSKNLFLSENLRSLKT